MVVLEMLMRYTPLIYHHIKIFSTQVVNLKNMLYSVNQQNTADQTYVPVDAIFKDGQFNTNLCLIRSR